MRRTAAAAALSAALVSLVPALANAQDALARPTSPLLTALGLAVLGLLPFALVVTTSFAKFAVVLAILRSALGTQNVPPNIVLAALAVMLTTYVMAPVAADTATSAGPLLTLSPEEVRDLDAWPARLEVAVEPLRTFLAANAGADELALFAELRGVEPVTAADAPISVVVPAFAITELAEAFQIGFLLFLPFLVLDLLVGAVLLSLGMHMLSPTSVSLPFKLLLFVLVNGWIVLSEGLVLGYRYGLGGG